MGPLAPSVSDLRRALSAKVVVRSGKLTPLFGVAFDGDRPKRAEHGAAGLPSGLVLEALDDGVAGGAEVGLHFSGKPKASARGCRCI